MIIASGLNQSCHAWHFANFSFFPGEGGKVGELRGWHMPRSNPDDKPLSDATQTAAALGWGDVSRVPAPPPREEGNAMDGEGGGCTRASLCQREPSGANGPATNSQTNLWQRVGWHWVFTKERAPGGPPAATVAKGTASLYGRLAGMAEAAAGGGGGFRGAPC